MGPAVGVLIGGMFGLVFVWVNSGDPLPAPLTWTMRLVAVVALATIMVRVRRPQGLRHIEADGDDAPMPVGRGYAVVVAAEVATLVVGAQVIRVVDAPSQTGVAWVATVVGIHFIALSRVWRAPTIIVPGAGLTALGTAGLVLVTTPAVRWVPLVSGACSGLLLLSAGLAMTRRPDDDS